MSSDDQKLLVANAPTKFKIRIHSQAFILKRREFPKMEKQISTSGLVVAVENWYDEHALGEFAVNYNGTDIPQKTLKEMLGNLGSSVMKSLQNVGVIRW